MSTSTQTRAPREAPARRWGVGVYVGVALILAGLGMLGYVGWQLFGTNVVAHRAQQQVIQDLRNRWDATAPAGSDTGPGTGAAEPGLDARAGEPIALIRIPRFGADYEIPVLQGVADDVLAQGFGHFADTAGPGEQGNFALAAHRVTHGEPLRDMPDLRPGDKVVVETQDAVYTYRLDTNPNDLVVTFHDVWVLDPVPTNPRGGVQPAQDPGQRLITLTTCAELFHTDNRMVAFGHLVRSEAKSTR